MTKSLLAYSLLPEGLGSYFVCVLFGALAGTIGTLATGRGVQYSVMAKRISVSEGMSIAFAICLIGSAVAAAAALPLIHSGFSFFLKADKSSFYLALLLIPSSSLVFATRLQLQGLRRFTQLAVISLIQAAVGVASILTLVWGIGPRRQRSNSVVVPRAPRANRGLGRRPPAALRAGPSVPLAGGDKTGAHLRPQGIRR